MDMNVILATGVPELDEAIEQRIKKINFVGSALYKEAVVEITERKQPDLDAIILSELLEGVMTTRELVLKLRTRFPDTRIIYIMKEESAKEKSFLYQWSVFDILPSKFGVSELETALFNPKEFKDVAREMEELKDYQKPSDLIDDEPDLSSVSSIDGERYDRINSPGSGTDTVYQQIVAFWAARDQAGKTFSAVNTSLMLSTSKDLKILLLDFNLDNPNIHLQYRVSDADRNLGALVEDVENGQKITKATLNDYLITHPVYKNLMILPGYILKLKKREPEQMIEIYDQILSAAQQNNFSTILVDIDSGIREKLTAHILKKATRILLHVSEDPGSLNAVRRLFDAEVGPFVANLIDKKRVVPIITKSKVESRVNFKKALEINMEVRVGSIIEYSDEIISSLYNGQPILSKKPSEEIYNSFINISNLIHKNLFRKPVSRDSKSSGDKKDSKSLLGGLFGGKKK
jgi:MinD-like ATPase involved in chromosome partitioning or flagellar assembly